MYARRLEYWWRVAYPAGVLGSPSLALGLGWSVRWDRRALRV
jgi:hypothetical protein